MNTPGIGKTPVTALQEFCAKKRFALPKYEFLEEDKIFYCKVDVLEIQESFQGFGRSKQEAKHNAACNLIKHLRAINYDIDYIPQLNELHANIPTKDAVALLRDLCLEYDHPFPQFEIIQQTGSPEGPEFTYRCIVASIQRYGSASTKKAAKQKAAQQIIDIINTIPKEITQQQIISFEEASSIEDDINEKKIKTYRQFIDSDIKMEPPGTLLKDRHNYFKKLNPEYVEAAINILNNDMDYISDHNKIDDLLKALHIKYSTEMAPSNGIKLNFIQLLLTDYDCCFCGTDNIYTEMIDYFKDMLL